MGAEQDDPDWVGLMGVISFMERAPDVGSMQLPEKWPSPVFG
jgi:hypothetical protein